MPVCKPAVKAKLKTTAAEPAVKAFTKGKAADAQGSMRVLAGLKIDKKII